MSSNNNQTDNLTQHCTSGNAAIKPVPRIISWNTTIKCNLRCGHCYINAQSIEGKNELSTQEGKVLIDQIADIGRLILVLSGGEPLLRKDIFELASYGSKRGLIMTMGTNGTLIDDAVAQKLFGAGIKKVAISVDSSTAQVHDKLREVKGSWDKAVEGVKACIRNGVGVQFNVTITRQNYNDLDGILNMAKILGVKSVHLFFLVPTGRGRDIMDISPAMYEGMLRKALSYPQDLMEIKPTCAPQFMRIAKEVGLATSRWNRGCIAGISYCRILPDGSVTPCPYLPVKVGNIRQLHLKTIWTESEILSALRNFGNLKGKCGVCGHRSICGGCRARAYGLTSYCSGANTTEQGDATAGDFLAEDSWCTYQP